MKFLCFSISFPLTLTLSLGAREQAAKLSIFLGARTANPVAGFRMRRETILPLPRGEGRDEGNAGERLICV
jgi:hypothetical protein